VLDFAILIARWTPRAAFDPVNRATEQEIAGEDVDWPAVDDKPPLNLIYIHKFGILERQSHRSASERFRAK
jgi:hypothetical protein